jgi:hypothetical protein
MKINPRWALCALLFSTAPSALAQDEIVLGSPVAAAPGEVVRVPVFIRDVAGTPLGIGGQAPIQWVELSITHSHPHLVTGCLGTTWPNCDLQFEPAGVLSASPPASSGTLINVASLYVRRVFNGPLALTGDLDPIGFVTFRLDPRAPVGAAIQLRFDPAKTFLANGTGTIVDRGLKLVETSVRVDLCLDPPGRPDFDFFGPVSECTSQSGRCRAGEHVEFTTLVPVDACDTITWSFGDGTSAVTKASTIRHRYTLLPNDQVGATFSVTATVTRPGGSSVSTQRISIEPGCTATVPDTAVAGVPVVFMVDAIGTAPPRLGDSVSWRFGDGSTAEGNPVQHTYRSAGTYLWEATISFGASGICVVRRPIRITEPVIPRQRAARP